MKTQLDEILAVTRRGVSERKTRYPTRELERAASLHQPRGFARALMQDAVHGPAVIAELKKASPSRGLIREQFEVPVLAAGLAAGGASALSVLTEEQFFQGSLRNLELASQACKLPCLRKDFIVDEFQILEARAHRADAILLIAAALSDAELSHLSKKAKALELDVLCEVHTAEELDRVLSLNLGCEAIGVNNRDLKSFKVSLQVSLDLAARLPKDAVRVAESGIASGEDLNRLREAGFQAFLMGESLMSQPDPGAALDALLKSAANLTAASSR